MLGEVPAGQNLFDQVRAGQDVDAAHAEAERGHVADTRGRSACTGRGRRAAGRRGCRSESGPAVPAARSCVDIGSQTPSSGWSISPGHCTVFSIEPDRRTSGRDATMTTRTELRWGVLGVAKINDRLLPAFAKARHSRLHGIASRSLEKAQAAAARCGHPARLWQLRGAARRPRDRRRLHPAAQHDARRVDAQGRRRRQAHPVRKAAHADRAAGPGAGRLLPGARRDAHGRLHVAAPPAHGPDSQADRRRGHRPGPAGPRRVHVSSAARPGQHSPAVRHGRRQPARCRLLPGLWHPLGVRCRAGARLCDRALRLRGRSANDRHPLARRRPHRVV